MYPSKSEDNGIATLNDNDLSIYSVGISTGGVAEIRMAELNPKRRIIATTIDSQGAKFAQKNIDEKGLSKRIIVKTEDVSKPLEYKNETFDFIYARLVLHYLKKDQLSNALSELARVLKKGKKSFIVVRSTKCEEANLKNAKYDPLTYLTTYSNNGQTYSRYFHTESSIQESLEACGFAIEHVKSYQEQLCIDFQRTQPSNQIDSLIEVVASIVD